jgi:hypothetical protein
MQRAEMNMAIQRRTQNFYWGGEGADPVAVYSLYLILKMSGRSRQNLRVDIQLGYREN